MQVSFWIYIFILIFAPLAFASAELWSISTIEVLTGVSAVLFFCSRSFYKKKFVSVPGITPLLLLPLFMALQLIPLPTSVVQFISPATYNAYEPVLSLGGSGWIPLTINQHGTLQELLRIFCYSLFYILTVQLLSIGGHLKKTVFIVIGLAAAIGLLAIIQRVGSPDKIYWFRIVPDNASPFGPWINPNQFAGFMEILCPIALGLFLFFKPRFQPDESLRHKIVNFFTMPSSNLHLFLGFAASLMFLSVFVSLSRGGIMTITLAVVVFILLYSVKKARQGRAAIFAIVGCVVIAVSWFGWDSVFAEFNKTITFEGTLSDGRFLIWADTIRVFQSFFLFGSGFGTYIDVFPAFMRFPDFGILDHAHNDYLELLTDGGVIGFGLAAWFICSVLHHGWKMIQSRRDQYAVLVGIGALTGIIAMLMHGVTDFNMHNGAVGLYFFFCCGLLVAVTNVRFVYCDTQTLLKDQVHKKSKYYLLAALLFTVVSIVVQFGALRAQAQYNKTAYIYISQRLKPALRDQIRQSLHSAITFSPLNYFYSYKLGSIERLYNNKNQSLDLFVRAGRQNPMNGATIQSIGLLIDNEEQAKQLLEIGYERGLDDDELASTLVQYLLKKDQRIKAAEIMTKRLEKNHRLLLTFANLFEEYSFDRGEIANVFSSTVNNWFTYGSILEKENNFEEAEYYFTTALDLLPHQETIKPHWFQQLIRFYQKNDQSDQALLILRQAVETLPDYIPFHLQLGDHYRKEGIQFRAKEEYERVLILQPGNRDAEKRLRQIGLIDSY